jgi:acetyltransferase-like isoleucine patch superfamily enzyme
MSVTIQPTAIVHPGVTLGKGAIIEDFCIIGAPQRGSGPGDHETIIGPGAHIRSHTVIYAGNKIGRNFQTGNKANVRESNIIGDDVSIGTLCVVEHHVEIGKGVRLHTQVFVPEFSRLADHAWLGPQVVLTNALYPTSSSVKSALKGPILGERCRIGAGTTILPGVTIGARTLVGAGSVVTRDLPADVIAYGNPARVRRPLSELVAYQDEVDTAG